MDLNVIFSLSALGAFAISLMFRLSYKISLVAALMGLAGAAALIFMGHNWLGNEIALATFYLFALGIILMAMDHLLALKMKVGTGPSSPPEGAEK